MHLSSTTELKIIIGSAYLREKIDCLQLVEALGFIDVSIRSIYIVPMEQEIYEPLALWLLAYYKVNPAPRPTIGGPLAYMTRANGNLSKLIELYSLTDQQRIHQRVSSM